MKASRLAWWCLCIVLLTIASGHAQAPSSSPTLTPIESRDVLITQLNERIAALQNEVMRLQLILDKQQRTPPPKDGYVWDWTPNDKGEPKGYVKAPEAEKAK